MKQLAVLLLICVIGGGRIFAGEIREFDVKTLERLGNELNRVSRQPDRGATDPIRKHAKQTAMAALKGQLFKIHYDYILLDDPEGKGFLVYALGTTNKAGELVLAGHVRITVSADGSKVERVDHLSQTLMVARDRDSGVPAGYHLKGYYFNQIVSNRPVETFIYLASLAGKNIYVQTPSGRIWRVNSRGMKIDTSKPSDKTEAGAAHKAFDR